MIDTNRLWLAIAISVMISLIIGLPRLLTYLSRVATETRQELDAVSSGSAYDGMIDAQGEELTPSWEVILLEQTERTYTALQTQAYARCLETLLAMPGKSEDVRKGA